MAAWTFVGTSFTWLRGGNATMPIWTRKPRLSERQIIGTGEAEIAKMGYEPYRMSGEIWVVTQSDYNALEALIGTSGVVSDGTTSWNAVLVSLDLAVREPGPDEGFVGTAAFTRPQP